MALIVTGFTKGNNSGAGINVEGGQELVIIARHFRYLKGKA
jgi:hypothetical protein